MLGDNGDKEKVDELKRTLNRMSIESAFNTAEGISAIRYLVEAGETIRGLLMRGIIPAKQTEDKVWAIAAMHHLAKAEEFGDGSAQNELLNLIAFMVSMRGRGREQLVESIIGEHQQKKGELGFGDKLRKMAGLGDEEKK